MGGGAGGRLWEPRNLDKHSSVMLRMYLFPGALDDAPAECFDLHGDTGAIGAAINYKAKTDIRSCEIKALSRVCDNHYCDDVEATFAIGFDRWPIGRGACVTDRDIDPGIRPVVASDGLVDPGIRREKPVRSRASATDRGISLLPVACHNSMSLLQAPTSTSVDPCASAIDRGIDAGIWPVISGDGNVEPGVRGQKPVRDRASATDRGIGCGLLP